MVDLFFPCGPAAKQIARTLSNSLHVHMIAQNMYSKLCVAMSRAPDFGPPPSAHLQMPGQELSPNSHLRLPQTCVQTNTNTNSSEIVEMTTIVTSIFQTLLLLPFTLQAMEADKTRIREAASNPTTSQGSLTFGLFACLSQAQSIYIYLHTCIHTDTVKLLSGQVWPFQGLLSGPSRGCYLGQGDF